MADLPNVYPNLKFRQDIVVCIARAMSFCSLQGLWIQSVFMGCESHVSAGALRDDGSFPELVDAGVLPCRAWRHLSDIFCHS